MCINATHSSCSGSNVFLFSLYSSLKQGEKSASELSGRSKNWLIKYPNNNSMVCLCVLGRTQTTCHHPAMMTCSCSAQHNILRSSSSSTSSRVEFDPVWWFFISCCFLRKTIFFPNRSFHIVSDVKRVYITCRITLLLM